MNKDILDLNNGIVPEKLMFCIKKRSGLDWDNVMYNARYWGKQPDQSGAGNTLIFLKMRFNTK